MTSMKLAAFGAALVLFATVPASAADDARRGQQEKRLALGIGAGIVTPDEEGEVYLTAGLRIRLGKGDDRSRRSEGVSAYIEPEVGYWERSGGFETSDLSLGVNLLGVVPSRRTDYFFGVGFALHSFDYGFDPDDIPEFDDSDTRLGGNFQVGLDVNLNDSVSLFGVGRLDILEGSLDDNQTKVVGGLRFKF